jgi:hypothetical protein
MYWDSDAECVSLSFPINGYVAQALARVGHAFNLDKDEDEEDEDIYGIFS